MHEIHVQTPDKLETLIVRVKKEECKAAYVKRVAVKQYDKGKGKKYVLCNGNERVLHGFEQMKEGAEYHLEKREKYRFGEKGTKRKKKYHDKEEEAKWERMGEKQNNITSRLKKKSTIYQPITKQQ